jgi:protein-S-isoprenylcysteine O-methyltransferase Ste14
MHLALYLPVLIVALAYLFRLKEVLTKREVVSGPQQEKLTFALFGLAVTVMCVGGSLEYLFSHFYPSLPQVLAGILVIVASFRLRVACIRSLGKLWSLHVEMRDGHEFVTTGPFRWMRHPVYFSMILELAGPAIVLGAWYAFIPAIVLFAVALSMRLALEEPALVAKFGEAYVAYMKATPSFIPYRIPR